ncbi:hypothetical protein [Hamadaea tsunoensis]|uniref:hypothetical protein n=1 Tax=Hamadaea tsunoensis TaxID=53368 RepID=UPI00048882C2|nr:hypothetical protein [Hamadaea tsunoensis]
MSTPQKAHEPADAPADALTIALTEYGFIAQLQSSMRDQAAARFNFFLAVATAAAAVVAGLLSSGNISGAGLGAVAALGVLVLVMGISIFVRQVEFTQRGMRYAAAHDAVRTYLVGRAGPAGAYILLPTLHDRGVIGEGYRRLRWRRDIVGLAGTVALINSALAGGGAGLLLGRIAPTLPVAVTVAAAVAAFLVLLSLQIGYLQRAKRLTHLMTKGVIEQRGLRADEIPVQLDRGGVGE